MSEPWLDKRGLSEHFACSVRTVEGWVADGAPHAVIAGRVKFRATEAERWLEATGRIELRGVRAASTVVAGSQNGAGTADTAPRLTTRRYP